MSEESISPAPQPQLSPETLQDGPWFQNVRKAYEVRTMPAAPPRWVVPAVGVTVAVLLWLLGWEKTAIVGVSIVAVLTLLDVLHPQTARKVQKVLSIFGVRAGQAIGWILLAPMFLIVGPLSRVFNRVMGTDPLGRRMAKAPSYWYFTAAEKKRTRRTRGMFCVEHRAARGRNWLGALLLLGVLGLVGAEIVLRVFYGLHNPLLYQNDADCGYRIRPGQHIVTAVGEVNINNYSMRYPRDITPEKPPGVFRILMVGDSTLFGGEDIADRQTFAAIVEEELNKQGIPGKKFEVLPVGCHGWGPHHMLGYIRRYGTFGADLTLIVMSAGNAERPRYLVDGQRYLVRKPGLALQTVFAKLGWDTLRYCATGGTGDYNQSEEQAARVQETGEDAFVETAREILKSCPECMAESIPQINNGMDGEKGTFEMLPSLCTRRSFLKLQPRLEELGVPMRYPQDLFVGKGPADGLWRRNDRAHLGLKGHRIFAGYLLGRIAEFSRGFRKYTGPAEPPGRPVSQK